MLTVGIVISIAGVVLMGIRLLSGELGTYGIISTVLLILSGLILAWKPWRERQQKKRP